MGRWPPAVLLALVAAGEIALLRDLDGIWIVVAALPLVVFAVLRMIGGPAPVRAVTLVLGALVVPVFALLGRGLGLGAGHRLAPGRAPQPPARRCAAGRGGLGVPAPLVDALHTAAARASGPL